MSIADTFATALAVLASLGGGGLIVCGLSGWLGRVWAERMMEQERQRFREDLERLRADLDPSGGDPLQFESGPPPTRFTNPDLQVLHRFEGPKQSRKQSCEIRRQPLAAVGAPP